MNDYFHIVFLKNCINKIYEKAQDASKKVIAELSAEGSSEDLEEAKDLLEASDDEKPIIRLVNSLLSRAVKEKASDIHIEPYDLEVIVRVNSSLNPPEKLEVMVNSNSNLRFRV